MRLQRHWLQQRPPGGCGWAGRGQTILEPLRGDVLLRSPGGQSIRRCRREHGAQSLRLRPADHHPGKAAGPLHIRAVPLPRLRSKVGPAVVVRRGRRGRERAPERDHVPGGPAAGVWDMRVPEAKVDAPPQPWHLLARQLPLPPTGSAGNDGGTGTAPHVMMMLPLVTVLNLVVPLLVVVVVVAGPWRPRHRRLSFARCR